MVAWVRALVAHLRRVGGHGADRVARVLRHAEMARLQEAIRDSALSFEQGMRRLGG